MATQYYNEPQVLLDRFFQAYAVAALTLSEDAEGKTLSDIAPESVERMRKECLEFLIDADHNNLGITEDNVEQAGNDFWLARTGSGSGFFDREEVFGEQSEALHTLAQEKEHRDIYLGDDNVLYQFPH